MRQFDTYQSYLDNSGDPLVGRIRFCNLDGSPANIVDIDGNDLPNPMLTDSSGRTAHQVFLEDIDYLVYFDKYVGHSVMTEDVEEDSWDCQGAAVNRYNTLGVNVDVEGGFQGVKTIEELKNLDPNVNSDIVMLLGYDAEGDKPSVMYRWVPTSTLPADGGAVIASSVPGVDSGKWVMIPAFNYLDVRHFGAFPSSTSVASARQRLAIQNASAYANKLGINLYFYGDNTKFNYDVGGLTLNNVDSSDKAVFFIDGDNDAIMSNVKKANCKGNIDEESTGKITLRGAELRTSYNMGNTLSVVLEPSVRLVFDTEYSFRNGIEVNDVECVLEVDQDGTQSRYNNCTFSGKGKFKDETLMFFTGCELHQSMFENFTAGYMTITNCYTDFNAWSDKKKYIDFMIANGNTDIDLYGYEIEGDVYTYGKDLGIRNASIMGRVNCRNFKCLNSYVESVKAKTYDIRDSDVGVGGDVGDYSFGEIPGSLAVGFNAYNSTIRLYADLWISSFTSIVGCTVPYYGTNRKITIYPRTDSYILSGLYTMRDITLRSSTFGCPLYFTVAGVNVTPFDYNDEGVMEYHGYEDIKVENLVCRDNVIYNPNGVSSILQPVILDDRFRAKFNTTQGNYEFRGNYSYTNRVFMLENNLDRSEFTYVGKIERIPFLDMGNRGLYPSDQLCLKRFIYCFGEDKNLCSYGFDKVKVNHVKISWEESHAAGYYENSNTKDVEVRSSDGYNYLNKSFVPDGPLVPTYGQAGVGYASDVDITFTIQSTKQIRYNMNGLNT